MRPGQQQNRRTRRGNNNRKASNPLARSYESNGPDVKIRGSAQQIADKYLTLARDAQSSGDRVIAENYLQHAEHYSRIVAAAQAQAAAQAPRENRDDNNTSEDNNSNEASTGEAADNAEGVDGGSRQPASADTGTGPQPVIEGTPVEVAIEEEAAAANEGEKRARGRSRKPNRPVLNEANGTVSSTAASDEAVPNGDAAGETKEAEPRRSRRPRASIAISQEAPEAEDSAPRQGDDSVANDGDDKPDTPSIATG